MTDINRVTLIGRLTRDCEVRYSGGGLAVCRFSIAVNYSRKSGEQWVEEVSYFDMVLFGKQGEAVSKYLLKGKQVGIEGKLQQNRWEQEGKNRSKVEVVVNNVQLLGGNSSTGQSYRSDVNNAPSAPPSPAESASSGAENSATAGSVESFEDDIPF